MNAESSGAVTQMTVIQFLASDQAHGGQFPHHIETHLSHVFVTTDRVYKLKKAQTWSVVDYSTLERRKHFCDREIEVNAQIAGDLYIGVIPVTCADGLFAIGGSGEIVEWLVVMNRFRSNEQFDRMLADGTLTSDLIDATADVTAHMHRTANAVRVWPAAERVAAVSRQLASDLMTCEPDDSLRDDIKSWEKLASKALDANRSLLDRRGRHGFVRRCHGDLHLSNICIWRGQPTPFDAIEFSEEIATIDITYDLSFVLIDLEARGREDHSNRLLSRYLEATRDYAGLALLPLFKSQRAMVRALVTSTKSGDAAPLVGLAIKRLTAVRTPFLLAVGGLSGTGKTTVARALAPALDAVSIRSDVVRKHLMGVPPETPLDPSAYDAETTKSVYRRLRVDARRALRSGCPVILDATFTEPFERTAAEATAASLNVPFHGIWLEAPLPVLRQRIGRREHDASDADLAVLNAQAARSSDTITWRRVTAAGNVSECTAAILRSLPTSHPGASR